MSTDGEIRGQFKLNPSVAQFATLVFASHPHPIRKAVKKYRRRLDRVGFPFFRDHSKERRIEVLEAIARYFDVEVGLAAVTHATTVGLAQILGGVTVARGQEFLTSTNEHPATTETLRRRTERDGTPFRQVPLFVNSRTATAATILRRIADEIRPTTRVLALTWVYSCDGVKLPVADIAALVATENRRRASDQERLLFVLDGVHGFGIENTTFPALDCDFFISGCHKSIFGPRGTAIICGKRDAWKHIVAWTATLSGANEGPASAHVPGGVHTYEHWWGLGKAFDFHVDVLGKGAIERRIRQLAGRLKAGLAAIDGVTVVTPDDPALSAALVCCDVGGKTAGEVLKALEQDDIIASESAPDATARTTHVRFAVSIINSDRDVERALEAVARIVRSP